MTAIRYDIIFTGRVQGVFFRATAQQIARDFIVTGWVRNEADGSVRLVAEGEAAELDRFTESVQRAKADHITGTRINCVPATGEFDDFTVRR